MIKYFCDYCESEIKNLEDILLQVIEKDSQEVRVVFNLCPKCVVGFRKDIKTILKKYIKGRK